MAFTASFQREGIIIFLSLIPAGLFDLICDYATANKEGALIRVRLLISLVQLYTWELGY